MNDAVFPLIDDATGDVDDADDVDDDNEIEIEDDHVEDDDDYVDAADNGDADDEDVINEHDDEDDDGGDVDARRGVSAASQLTSTQRRRRSRKKTHCRMSPWTMGQAVDGIRNPRVPCLGVRAVPLLGR